MATTATADARSLRGPGHPATPSREDRLDAAHQLLMTGLAELTTSDAWQRMLTTAARFHSYSIGNILLIAAQRPDATRVAGLRTWNSLGRKVNKGEHGIRIIVPITRKHTDEPTGDDEHQICGFSVGTVFDESQTSGDDLDPIAPLLLTGTAPDGLADKVCALIESEGFTVTHGDCRPANGLTSWITRTVTIRDDLEPAAQLKTLLHDVTRPRPRTRDPHRTHLPWHQGSRSRIDRLHRLGHPRTRHRPVLVPLRRTLGPRRRRTRSSPSHRRASHHPRPEDPQRTRHLTYAALGVHRSTVDPESSHPLRE